MKQKIAIAVIVMVLFLYTEAVHFVVASEGKELLARLESKFSLINTLSTDFTQEKELSSFEKKIIIKGTLCFKKPNLFAWHVKEPIVYSMVVKGKTIQQWDEETRKVQTLNVESNPALRIMMVRMREWFTGNFTGFLGEYDFAVENKNPLTLLFVPKEASTVAAILSEVRVIFKSDESYISQIEIAEKNGDSTVLIFGDVAINKPLRPGLLNVKDNF